MEDSWLIHRCKLGSEGAFRRIYAKYRDFLFKLAVSIAPDAHTAEDIVHDVFVAFAENMADFRLTGSLKAYLSVCVANRAKNCLRSKSRQTCTLEEAGPQADLTDGPAARIQCNEQLLKLAEAMRQLPFEQRQIISLRHFSRMRTRAIAQSLELSENTVKSRYRYGIDKLRQILKEEVIK
ncbi:MAG: RNA polymerase sigma factor [Planctomycetota bacterium]|jgi:RNA polymerase sigma-70 factor (ECF subfamily)